MKKIKQLITLASVGVLASTLVPIMTSCSKQEEIPVKITALDSTTTYLVGQATSQIQYFACNKTIDTEEKITLTCPESSSFKCEILEIQANSVIKTKFTLLGTNTQERIEKDAELTFTSSKGWTTKTTQKLIYTPGLNIQGDRKASGQYDPATKASTHIYHFEVEEFIKATSFDVRVIRDDNNSSKNCYATVTKVEQVDSMLNITMDITSDQPGDKTMFDLEIKCLDSIGQTICAPILLTGFELIYTTESIQVTQDAFTWSTSENDDLDTLISFDSSKIEKGNTLYFPKLSPNGKKYQIKDGIFDGLSEQIYILKFEDITDVTIPANLFAGLKITILDLSLTEEFDNVDNFNPGSKSFSFSTSGIGGTGGSILWHKNADFYDGHVLTSTLWRAGLNSPLWYDAVGVWNEKDLRKASWTGETIRVMANITLTSSIEFRSTVAVLDLNGMTIDAKTNLEGKALFNIIDSSVIITDSKVGMMSETAGSIEAFNTTTRDDDPDFAINIQTSSESSKDKSALYIYAGRFVGNKSVIFNNLSNVYVNSITREKSGETVIYEPEFKVYDNDLISTCKSRMMLGGEGYHLEQKTANYILTAGKFMFTNGKSSYDKYNPGSDGNAYPNVGFDTKSFNFVHSDYKVQFDNTKRYSQVVKKTESK